MINAVLMVAVGGAMGSVLRYLIGLLFSQTHWGTWLPNGWSFGVLMANLLGCLVAGALYCLTKNVVDLPENILLLLFTGFLGGLTTFSAFELDIFKIIELGHWPALILYTTLSVVGGLLFVGLGYWLVRATVTTTTGV